MGKGTKKKKSEEKIFLQSELHWKLPKGHLGHLNAEKPLWVWMELTDKNWQTDKLALTIDINWKLAFVVRFTGNWQKFKPLLFVWN